jgi:hypothetical protein
MAKIEKYNNGCGRIIINDINYEEIALDSLKKDLIDWCKADREKWLKNDLNTIYEALYIPTRKARFELLDDEVKKKPFGINMDVIKGNAMLRYAIARVKLYNSSENFIKEHGEFVFNRFFRKDGNLDTRWETIEELIKNNFS